MYLLFKSGHYHQLLHPWEIWWMHFEPLVNIPWIRIGGLGLIYLIFRNLLNISELSIWNISKYIKLFQNISNLSISNISNVSNSVKKSSMFLNLSDVFKSYQIHIENEFPVCWFHAIPCLEHHRFPAARLRWINL